MTRDRADQVPDLRVLAEVRRCGNHVDLEPAEELHALGADQAEIHFDALFLALANLGEQLAKFVHVEAAAETLVGGHHDVADPLDGPLHQERVAILGVGLNRDGR